MSFYAKNVVKEHRTDQWDRKEKHSLSPGAVPAQRGSLRRRGLPAAAPEFLREHLQELRRRGEGQSDRVGVLRGPEDNLIPDFVVTGCFIVTVKDLSLGVIDRMIGFNKITGILKYQEEEIKLTLELSKIFMGFMEAEDYCLTYEQLSQIKFGSDSSKNYLSHTDKDTLSTTVRLLRKKLQIFSFMDIENLRGTGYRILFR